jgi:hypothetical protein
MSIQSQIIASTRRSGNTTWILKGAINNPNCIIVCLSEQYAKQLSLVYRKMLYDQPWYKKLWWKIVGREAPVFTSLSNCSTIRDSRGKRMPIIFDNSAIK